MVFVPPSASEIKQAADDVVKTLRAICGEGSFFFVGSFACQLYGKFVAPYDRTMRSPNDLDVVVSTAGWNQEELKRRMVAHNSSFFTVAAKTPGATYRVLKYHCDDGTGLYSAYGRYSRYSRVVKVDVLIANVTLDIPSVPARRIREINGYPVSPLALLILLRLQAWDHHRVAIVRHLSEKAYVDYRDLTEHLLPFAKHHDVVREWDGALNMWADAKVFLPEKFIRLCCQRMGQFCEQYPSQREAWKSIGKTLPVLTRTRASADEITRLISRMAFD
ncbi:hypothetical protein BKA62DRAFT_664630 [Auriculariales sp. MPI-PUGE-AT-0066]|nr:hypothetical protein BKA62DRAFT_664630 [Auriculariales sp. MPI-PUGE-AT-0066]